VLRVCETLRVCGGQTYGKKQDEQLLHLLLIIDTYTRFSPDLMVRLLGL